MIAAGRIRLRAPRPSDAGAIAVACADARVARMTTRIPHPYPPGAAEAFVAEARRPGGELVYVVDGAELGLPAMCGVISVRPLEGGASEIGYWIAPPLWRKGLGRAAIEAVAGADPTGAGTLVATVFEDNAASAALLLSTGFVEEGRDDAFSIARGAIMPRRRFRKVIP
jgi:RimJ/RimL family protein N-acetyltransferase